MFSKANDWGEAISEKTLDIAKVGDNNKVIDEETCIKWQEFKITGEGLGFSLPGDKLFYKDGDKFKIYVLNANGSLEYDGEEPVPNGCNNDCNNADDKENFLDVETIRKPSKFDLPKCKACFPDENSAVGAISAHETSIEGAENIGAIAFYNKRQNLSGWHLRGVIHGENSGAKLGEHFLEFEDEHDLKAISGDYKISYASDVLVSCNHYVYNKIIYMFLLRILPYFLERVPYSFKQEWY